MPKIGMEAMRKAALVDAAIAEIGETGSLDVTVARIARRAGVSSALAHHYFGSKDRILLAAMRHILAIYGHEVRSALARAAAPRDRLDAIVGASFGGPNFRGEVVAAWLNFYVQAQNSDPARRLLRVYHRRLRSNLIHELRVLAPNRAAGIADTVGALIDGVYIRQALREGSPNAVAAAAIVRNYIDAALAEVSQ